MFQWEETEVTIQVQNQKIICNNMSTKQLHISPILVKNREKPVNNQEINNAVLNKEEE